MSEWRTCNVVVTANAVCSGAMASALMYAAARTADAQKRQDQASYERSKDIGKKEKECKQRCQRNSKKGQEQGRQQERAVSTSNLAYKVEHAAGRSGGSANGGSIS